MKAVRAPLQRYYTYKVMMTSSRRVECDGANCCNFTVDECQWALLKSICGCCEK